MTPIKQQNYFWQPSEPTAIGNIIIALLLIYNSLTALHANFCPIWMDRRISDSLKYIQKHMAYMQQKMTWIDLRYKDFFRLHHSVLKL